MTTVRFPRSRLLLFAKAPVPGTVKTRLVPALGEAGAARLHARLVEHALAVAAGSGLAPVELWCAPATDHPFFAACAAAHPVRLRPQRGGDLGERMHHALAAALEEAESAVLMGSDCPAIDGGYLAQAFVALEEGADLVLGPAADGGYVLVGLRRPQPPLFRDIPWGGAEVLARTRERAHSLGLTVRELPELWDVDRPEDLARLRSLGWVLP